MSKESKGRPARLPSEVQGNVLYFIWAEVKENLGQPSYREIVEHFGWHSTFRVHDILQILIKKGYIEKVGKSRSVIFTELGKEYCRNRSGNNG